MFNRTDRAELVTKPYLDARLMQHTVATIASVALIAGLSKLFT